MLDVTKELSETGKDAQMEYTFEQHALGERPIDLIDLGGDDQWVDWTENGVISAVVVLGEHVIVWQDDPLTDEGKREIADYLRSRAQYEEEDLEDEEEEV
jgi:hypothetical protein